MARRSLLFSKKRSSKATLSKKRKNDKEPEQPHSAKHIKKSRIRADEEEVGDFIIVDTGTLYEPEKTNQCATFHKEQHDLPTSPTSEPPVIPLKDVEEKEIAVEAKPRIPSINVDVARQASETLSVLDSASTKTSEDKRSWRPSPESSENYIASGSKVEPLVVSPISSRSSPQRLTTSPLTVLEKLDSIISSSPTPVAEHNMPSPGISEETREDYQTPQQSLIQPQHSPEPSNLNISSTRLIPPNLSVLPVITPVESIPVEPLASKSTGHAPFGVLVTKGDQCPSKFMVSGAVNSEGGQQVPTESTSQTRNAVPWIETVTEARANTPSELPKSGVCGPGPRDSRGLGISEVLQVSPESPRRVSAQKDDQDPSTTAIHCSDELKSPVRSKQTYEMKSSDMRHASTNILERSTTEMQREAPKSATKDEIVFLGERRRERLPLPSQSSKNFPEATMVSEQYLLDLNTSQDTRISTAVTCLDMLPSVGPVGTSTPILKVGPEPSISSSSNSLSSLRFTFDNRAESTLTTVEVQRLVQIFVADAIALMPREHSAPPRSYPAGVVMWQSLPMFYKWYAKEEKKERGTSPHVKTMRFELLDVHWQPENVFLLPKKANLDEFRALKQCIWDLFWVATNLNGASIPFRILISRAAEIANPQNLGRLSADKPVGLKPIADAFSPPPSAQSNIENEELATKFGGFETISTPHDNRFPSARPPSLSLTSPPITLEVRGPKTPDFYWDFLQKNKSPVTGQFPSMNSSPTRPDNHEGSILRTDSLQPALARPNQNITSAPQLHAEVSSSPTAGLHNNLASKYHLPLPVPSGSGINPSPSPRIDLFSFQNKQTNNTIQLPSPRPSPVITETNQTKISHTPLVSAGNNYAANTARPLFAVPPQGDTTSSWTAQPPAQRKRGTNTVQPAPHTQVAQSEQPPAKDKDKDTQTETAPLIPQLSRTPGDKKKLREKAMQMIAGRQDIELEDDETTGGRKRTFPEVSGVIVDKNSALGLVLITERGYTDQQVDTGQDAYFDQYKELTLRDGQACVIHGSSTVLYYKPRQRPFETHQSPPPRKPLPSQAPQSRQFNTAEDVTYDRSNRWHGQQTLIIPPAAAEVKIRVQIDAKGRFSTPHDFWVLQNAASARDFFSWFGTQAARGAGPLKLRVTLKDAMPVAKVFDIARGGDRYFQYVREDILVQYERAKAFMPDLKEFGVLVVDPDWKEVEGNNVSW